jgi:hypothetical protein
MVRPDPTYGETEYQIKCSLRSRPGRPIAVFRVDSRFANQEWRTVFLDRAVTPVAENVLKEWAGVLDDLLTTGVDHRYGTQTMFVSDHVQEGGDATPA